MLTNILMFCAGFFVLLASTAILHVCAWSTIRTIHRSLVGLLVGRGLSATRLDRPFVVRMARFVGLDTTGEALNEEALEKLKPSSHQETIARFCFLGMAIGGAMIGAALFWD